MEGGLGNDRCGGWTGLGRGDGRLGARGWRSSLRVGSQSVKCAVVSVMSLDVGGSVARPLSGPRGVGSAADDEMPPNQIFDYRKDRRNG